MHEHLDIGTAPRDTNPTTEKAFKDMQTCYQKDQHVEGLGSRKKTIKALTTLVKAGANITGIPGGSTAANILGLSISLANKVLTQHRYENLIENLTGQKPQKEEEDQLPELGINKKIVAGGNAEEAELNTKVLTKLGGDNLSKTELEINTQITNHTKKIYSRKALKTDKEKTAAQKKLSEKTDKTLQELLPAIIKKNAIAKAKVQGISPKKAKATAKEACGGLKDLPLATLKELYTGDCNIAAINTAKQQSES